MALDAIMNQYRAEKIPDIINDYRLVRQKLGVKPAFAQEDEEFPWWSGDLEKEVADKDYLCARALTSLAILNGPTDLDDIFSAWKQIKSRFKEKKPDGYDPKLGQHPFSFFRGTIFHEYLNPNSEKCISKKLAKYIIKNDVSLRDTKFGEWILKKLGVEEVFNTKFYTNIKDITHTEAKQRFVEVKTYKSKNLFGDLTARALTRTSKYGTYALGGLGALHSVHEIVDGEDVKKEVLEPALQIGTTLVSTGYLGAIGYKHFGTIGSLAGMGLGSAIGTKVPDLFKHSPEIL